MNFQTNGYTILKMKKNPIDELFAAKLAEHRQEPSQRAYARFQEQLEQRHASQNNRKYWYFGAAAAMLLVGFGTFTSLDTPEKQSTLAAVEVTKKVVQPIVEPVLFASKTVKASNRKQAVEIQQAAIPQESVPATMIEKPNIVEESVASISKEITPVIMVSEVDSREVMMAGNTTPISKVSQIEPEKEVILTYEVAMAPQERLRQFDDEPIALLEAINFEEYHFLHKNDEHIGLGNSIFEKVAHQIKHIQKGERINFRELGLRPRDLVAKADRFFKKDLGLESIVRNTSTYGN